MARRRLYFVISSDRRYKVTAEETNGRTYLKFLDNHEYGETTQFDVIDVGGNRVRIQCVGTNRFWKLDRTDNSIHAQHDEGHTPDSLFESTVDEQGDISYKNVGNNMYISTQSIGEDCIKALAPDLIHAVRLICRHCCEDCLLRSSLQVLGSLIGGSIVRVQDIMNEKHMQLGKELERITTLTTTQRHKVALMIMQDNALISYFFSVPDDEKDEWARLLIDGSL
ncbi:hypothetical protein F8388_023656 [Cannabis sativa]|uniref:Uncharacterized protein n=3 Tax=Cannabis sativa TaxID=3483 RepID=A0A7J6GBX9_CANSA|nr:hypothetical protein F8388_023656 [Cannabis sativa]